MTQLTGDVANRVRRLPKPSGTRSSLQPVFEAVSNAIHAVFDRFGEEDAPKKGRIGLVFELSKYANRFSVTVSDNGPGLEPARFEAFCTTDTPFKISRGGKGVGRLLMLDAFETTHVDSRYEKDGQVKQRSFDFGLSGTEPIYNESHDQPSLGNVHTGTTIHMKALRGEEYAEAMPTTMRTIERHFASHFLADFLLGGAPEIVLSAKSKSVVFPEAITKLVKTAFDGVTFETEAYGTLTIESYLLHKDASSDFDGNHEIHLVSSRRTVQTRKIDGLLGLGRLGENDDEVFHACISGEFLDKHVNQERTQFNFEEKVAKELTRTCVDQIKERILNEQIAEYETYRRDRLETFVRQNPSYGFEPVDKLLARMPAGAQEPEAFASALVKHKVRADAERRTTVQEAVNLLTQNQEMTLDVTEKIWEAAQAATDDENRQLMEYVLRRKFIIEIMQALLGRVRSLPGKMDTHLEDTFHSLICPMRVVPGAGKERQRIEPVSHDLWLLDERMAPARYFASDARIDEIFEKDGDGDRVDLLVWDNIHGLGLGEEDDLSRVILVEFKRPERGSYKENYVLMRQMNRYMAKLKGGEIRSPMSQQTIRLSDDVVFHCYVVADLVGDLKADTAGWHRSPNGRGRYDVLKGDFHGTIEVIEWDQLVRDARIRNQNFVEAAGQSFLRRDEAFK